MGDWPTTLRKAREEIRQGVLAGTLHMSQARLSRWETGGTIPSLRELARWAGALGYVVEIKLKKVA